MSAKGFIYGRLGQDPTTKQIGNSQVTSFTLGVRTSTKGSDGNYLTNWYDCSAWGKTGENVMNHLKKGSSAIVSGDIALTDYTAQDGTQKFRLRMRADNVEFVGAPAGGNAAATQQHRQPSAQSAPSEPVLDDSDLPF